MRILAMRILMRIIRHAIAPFLSHICPAFSMWGIFFNGINLKALLLMPHRHGNC